MKVYLEHIRGYPEAEKYLLAHQLGRQLVDYLGKALFCLLLDSKVLLNPFLTGSLGYIEDQSWKLHPAAKALEAFLKKLILNKRLYEKRGDSIGDVFGDKKATIRTKIRSKKLIAKTKSTWDFCRNDVMHYQKDVQIRWTNVGKRYEEILEIVILLHKDFYGKSETDKEISEGFDKYISNRFKSKKYKLKRKILNFIDGLT